MSRMFRYLLVAALALFTLACSLISGPVSEVENAASTVQAFASEIPVETIESFATALPVQTIEALPSMIPDVSNYFDPTGAPVEEWNGIPVMPQATAGEEFSESTYGYTVPASATEVQEFYNQRMEELGWESSFSFPISDEGGILSFLNGEEFVVITISPDQDNENSLDVILQK